METKLTTRRSLSTVPSIKVPSPYNEKVVNGTERPHRGSRVIFLNENGNDVDREDKDQSFQEQNQKLRIASSALLASRRQSTSLDAAKFTAWYNQRRNSNLRRDQFLASFGKTTIRYPNLNDEDIMAENMFYLNVPVTMDSSAEPETPNTSNFKRRTQSAGPVLLRSSSSMKSGTVHKNLLEIRGTEYTGDPTDLNLTAKIRKQSAKRRIKRIMETQKEKAEQERLALEEQERIKVEAQKKKRRTLKSASFAVMVLNVSAAGFSFKNFTEKKKWLTEKRLWTRQIVSTSGIVHLLLKVGIMGRIYHTYDNHIYLTCNPKCHIRSVHLIISLDICTLTFADFSAR